MRFLSKTLALLLLAAVTGVSLGAQDFAPAKTPQPAADCHSHGQKVPVPAPVSHNCCQTAHSPAILQQSSISQPPVVQILTFGEFFSFPDAEFSVGQLRSPLVFPGDPPLTAPLLI
jgi:hypothetical protein